MLTPAQMTFLEKEWDWVMAACSVPIGEATGSAFAQIAMAYSEPHRYYHNLDHIRAMLVHPAIDVIESNPMASGDLASIRLAIWFHDIIYDPRSLENEARSCEVAKNALGALGVDKDRIRDVCELIMMTKDHKAPLEDWAAGVFLDLDLSILAAQPKTYQAYSEAIRKEYNWVPERDYCLGRRKILQGFLEQPSVFKTTWFQSCEARARVNLQREIAQIDAILRTLPP